MEKGFDSDQKPHANPPSWHLSLVCIYGSHAMCFNALSRGEEEKKKMRFMMSLQARCWQQGLSTLRAELQVILVPFWPQMCLDHSQLP